MHFTLAFKRLLYGQHFYSGLIVAAGVLGVALLARWVAGIEVAVGLGIGAVCTSVVDVPAPPHLKRADLALAALGGSLVTLLALLLAPSTVALLALVLAVSFVSGMLGSFGARTGPLGFSLVLSLVLAIGVAGSGGHAPARAAVLFLAGGLLYLVYGVGLTHLLRERTKAQALAECLFELAEYLRVLARFYGEGDALARHYAALAAQQARVAHKQQAARDIVFAGVRGPRDVRLAHALVGAIDLYEYLLSSHIERELLQRHYGGTDALAFLQALIDKAASDVEQLAYAVLRDRPVSHRIHYKAELFALEHELTRGTPGPALTALRTATRRVRHAVGGIEALRALVAAPAGDAAAAGRWNLRAFVSPASYSPKLVADQLRADSPVLRHAVRLALAMGCAFLLGEVLPYATHGYWILLTVGVVMRATYGATRQRRADRLAGNVIGVLIVAVLLQLAPPVPVLLGALFLGMALAHAFVTLNYRVTSAAACVMALLLVHFMHPGGFEMAERLLDTLIGALIAYAFSFVLPSWEHRAIPRQAAALVTACRDYTDAILETGGGEAGMDYRLARKRLFDATATLSAAFERMRLEPKARRGALAPLQTFVTASYLFAGHIATIRVLLVDHRGELDERSLAARLERCRLDLDLALGEALDALRSPSARACAVEPSAEDVDTDAPDWTASALLDRRLRLIRQATAHLLAASCELGRAWHPRAAPADAQQAVERPLA